ncbi:MAG: ATP synthase F1 subunit delta [Bacteroidales bacterium]|jgi:F-type H+-transporting ATPase subunit delta
MNHSKISVRYARALFESALEKKLLDNIYQDMILISELCALTEIKEFLKNPVIVPSKKIDIMHRLVGRNVDKLTLSFIDLVVEHERELFLPDIARAFRQETKKYKGITESILTTAVKVDDRIKKEISDLLSKMFSTKIEMAEVLDQNIIGGFILKVEDNYIDASVRSKLRKIEKELKSKTLSS